ncbi:AAA domain protein [Hydrogenophaga sp. RAC07]|uniref:ATP-dependent nuclease n=1 Tax=Hydrogenophaga sp. RAC07 TaxID=1842537 RepID=UPI0008554B5C|nr:AAA family ATPase [Hydrogenophaga sp. RAC07]AOF87344.1 AAA domain protein [Hydrogenophaga sp. RAC07]
MYITRVKVVNFRSLADVEVLLDDYTALVGLNDSGKSNLLRALNLFFNGQTDLGHQLSFANDFSQQAKVIGKKAKQIEIEIEFSPPKNYSDSGPVIWKKNFRADSLAPHFDQVYKKDGTKFSKGSRVEYWVRHIAFEYVPAIRGKHFFDILKRRLYTTLAATVAPKLTGASSSFLSDLRKEVKKIESESQRLLKLKTEFSLPRDLGELFEVLDFDAADSHARTALQYRGDGVQGRHVPLILKFLADQRKVNSSKGKPPSETVWGFEEPENNLELAKQIEVAEEFKDYTASVQILVSTHSPAFYGMAKAFGSISIAVRDVGKTSFVESVSPEDIDTHLGLMPFVEPYLARAVNERNELIQAIKDLKASVLVRDKPALYVEGSSDKKIIEAALKSLGLPATFEIVAKEGLNGGANWVAGCCVARAAMTDLQAKTAAVLDDDDAGVEGVSNIQTRCEAIGRQGRVKCFVVGRSNGNDEVRKVKTSGIKIPFGIEEVCGREAWEHAELKGWLEERGQELIEKNFSLLTKEKTLSKVIDELVDDVQVRRLIEYKMIPERKGQFAKYAADSLGNGGEMPLSLEALAREIHRYF